MGRGARTFADRGTRSGTLVAGLMMTTAIIAGVVAVDSSPMR